MGIETITIAQSRYDEAVATVERLADEAAAHDELRLALIVNQHESLHGNYFDGDGNVLEKKLAADINTLLDRIGTFQHSTRDTVAALVVAFRVRTIAGVLLLDEQAASLPQSLENAILTANEVTQPL